MRNLLSKHPIALGMVPAALFLILVFMIMRQMYMDDAHIGFHVVENALSGHGYVFNQGDRVEAVTNIGWLLFLTPFAALFPIGIIAKLLSLVCISLSIWLLSRIGASLLPKDKHWLIFLFPILVVIQFDFIFFSLAGMETAFLSLLVTIILYRMFLDRYHFMTALLCAFCFFVRPETLVIYPLYLLLRWLLDFSLWKKLTARLSVWLAVLTGLELVRFVYYGAWLPNTFASKPGVPLQVMLERLGSYGLNVPNVSTPFTGFFIVLLIILAFLSTPTKSAFKSGLAAIILCGYLFALYAPTDWTLTGRYFAPYTPVVLLAALIGGVHLYDILLKSLQSNQYILQYLTGACISIYILFTIISFTGQFRPANTETYPWYVMTSLKLEPAAKWINANTSSNAVIASRRIGALGRFSDRYIFDYTWGLPHRDVAQLIKKHKRSFDSPNSDLIAPLWQRYTPDYLLEDTEKINPLRVAKTDTLQIQGEQFVILKKFNFNQETDWVLCQKIGGRN